MNAKLLISGLVKLFCGLACMGLLIFLPAGTIRYPGAWLLIAILFVPMLTAGVIMWIKSPELLQKRLNIRERQKEQKEVISLSLLMFVAGFIVAGLDFHFGWSSMFGWINFAAAVLFLLGYLLYGEVLRENAWLSRTIEVQEHQQVVSTGLYGVVRHPMYAASILMFLAMPLVLGSLWAFIIFLIYPMLMVMRIKNEEEVLREGLAGYGEYTEKVRYRLIPFIW